VAAARSFEVVWLDAARLVDPHSDHLAQSARELADRLSTGAHVLACTATEAARAGHTRVPARALAEAGGELLARVLAAVPLSRVGVAGGDTSSLAVGALDAWGLSYLAQLAPGTALCRLHSEAPGLDGVEIMLKGGQMGGDRLFDELAAGTV